jgi:hypothetical protein
MYKFLSAANENLHAAYLANQAVFEIPFLTTRCPDHIFAQF